MLKRFFRAINKFLLLGAKPSSEMSQQWREDELSNYEAEERLKAGIY
jgi:hypothetical protein